MPIPPVSLPSGFHLTAVNEKAIAKANVPDQQKQQELFFEATHKQREAAIQRWYYEEGGKYALRWVKQHYRTHDGIPLGWDEPYYEELFLILGNPWIVRVIVIKGSQMGFSEALIAICAFLLAEIRISIGFCVDTKNKFQDLIAPRVQPALDQCQPVQKLRKASKESRQRPDIDTKDRVITVGGVPITFAYAGTQSGNSTGGRQVSANLSSFAAHFIIGDEIEGYPLKKDVLQMLTERQSRSTLPSKPMRCGSTPGGEGGVIDREMKNCIHHFDWWIICPHCQYEQYLYPFGNLCLAVEVEEDGIKEERFLNLAGEPYRWFHHCPEDAPRSERIRTAYIGCRNCGKEIDRETICQGHYADKSQCSHDGKTMKKGIRYTELAERLMQERKPLIENISVSMNRMSSMLFDVADSLGGVFASLNKADKWQQRFGLVTSIGGGRINRTKLLAAVGRQKPDSIKDRKPDLIVMGLDQGQGSNIAVIDHYWLGPEGDDKQRWIDAWKETVDFAYLTGGFEAALEFARRHQVNLIGVDMEPEVQKCAEWAREYPAGRNIEKGKLQILPMDQVVINQGEPFKKSERLVQGIKVPCFPFDRTHGYDVVRDRILLGHHILPEGLLLDESDEQNFLHHFQTLERLTVEKRWTQAKPDHFMAAAAFSDLAVEIHLCLPKPSPMVFGAVKR